MLDGISLARPCGADWSSMSGDERVRYCKLCTLNVYNISNMTRDEAEALIAEHRSAPEEARNERGARPELETGKLCVRFFRRADGTILTQDCPVGFAAVKRRVTTVVASGIALFAAVGSALAGSRDEPDGPRIEGGPEPRPSPRFVRPAMPKPDVAKPVAVQPVVAKPEPVRCEKPIAPVTPVVVKPNLKPSLPLGVAPEEPGEWAQGGIRMADPGEKH